MKHLYIGLSVSFACLAAVLPSTSTVVLSLAFLVAHMIQNHFGADTVAASLVRRMEENEASTKAVLSSHVATTSEQVNEAIHNIQELKEAQAQYNLAAGIQTTRRFF